MLYSRHYGCSLLALNKCKNIEAIFNENNELSAQIGWTVDKQRDNGFVAIGNQANTFDLLMAAFELELRILKQLESNSQRFKLPSTDSLKETLIRKGWNIKAHVLPCDEFTFKNE